MDQQTEQLIEGRYNELPDTIKKLLARPSLAASIRITAEKHRLPEDKIIRLEDLIVLVLMGFFRISAFEEQIIEQLLIPGSVATSLARDVESTIFSEVKDELAALYAEQDKNEQDATKARVPSAPAKTFRETALSQTTAPIAQQSVPSYKKPLTNTPSYKEDPYREKVE